MRISTLTISRQFRLATITASLTILYAFAAWSLEIPSLPQSRVEILGDHARYLASEELTGRGVDTPGIKLARDFIAREFAAYGLLPGGERDTYVQTFEAATGVTVKEPTSLSLGGASLVTLNTDWTPLGLSRSGFVEGEVVFAGYGITAKDYGYDDYAGLDVKGKIVILLRYEPPPKNDKSPFRKAPRYSTHAALRAKANNAREHGAAGMILVDLNTPGTGEKELISTRNSLWRGGNSLVAAQIRRSVIEPWLDARGVSLKTLKEKIDRAEQPASQNIPGLTMRLQVTLEENRERAENVVGILPGSDPELRKEAVVIGAHYDHLGFGHFGTLDRSSEGRIHHGADDNASGTAVLLDLARRLSQSLSRPARTIVFAAFSGEELGLYGSRHYVNYPPVRLSATKAMINLDMVGRLRENRVTVFGSRSAKGLSAVISEEGRRLGLEIRESDGIGRSDHMSFYNKKIPALHFFTGSHPDYHRPSDTWDKLNIEGMARVSDLVQATVRRIAEMREPLSFVSLPSRPPSNERDSSRGYGAYLGSIPDFGANDEGVRLAGVSDGSPAALAGLREGDVIIQFAKMKIQNLEDLTTALQSQKAGDEVEIVVLRTGKPLTVKAILRARG
jgi:hypothetical protein